MSSLLVNATDDTSSSIVEATGPILVTVTGTMPQGVLRITADIGGGESVAYTYMAGDQTSLARLEFAIGVSFQAHLLGVNGAPGVDIDVFYIDAA